MDSILNHPLLPFSQACLYPLNAQLHLTLPSSSLLNTMSIRDPVNRQPGIKKNFFPNIVLKNEGILITKSGQAF